jgi:three-Cys-motif partner protein
MATSDSRTIPWVIEQQTAVKHELLKSYMATWMKILWQQQERLHRPPHLVYVDGFAGPGEYWTSEERTTRTDGSPILVGKVANDLMKGPRKLDIIAFDDDRRTVDHLAPLLKGINTHNQAWEVSHADFSTGAQELMAKLAARLGRDYPTFFFIDPFGYSGFPMALLARILKHARTEVFVTFMTYDIVRFMRTPSFEKKMIELFGTEDFRGYKECTTPEERVNFVTTLYRRQLLSIARAQKVIGFRINTPGQRQRARYFLFHASHHIKALKVMKDAMDRTSDQDFKFEAIGVGAGEQFDLFVATPEAQIKALLLGHIRQAPQSRIEYSEIEDWAYERTSGVARHIKAALIELEAEGKVNIERKPRQLRTTVANGASIHFVPTLP